MKTKHINLLLVLLLAGCSFKSFVVERNEFIAKAVFNIDEYSSHLIFEKLPNHEISEPVIKKKIFAGDKIVNIQNRFKRTRVEVDYADILSVYKTTAPGAPQNQFELYSETNKNYIIILNEYCEYVIDSNNKIVPTHSIQDFTELFMSFRKDEAQCIDGDFYRIFPYALYLYRVR